MNRMKGGGFDNTDDMVRKGANHIVGDKTRALGTHLSYIDGSTIYHRFEAMKRRGSSWGSAIFWW